MRKPSELRPLLQRIARFLRSERGLTYDQIGCILRRDPSTIRTWLKINA